jgi:hypothetical protein
MTSTIESTESSGVGSIVDALLPNCADPPLDAVASSIFIDDGKAVPVTPIDQLLMTAAREAVSRKGCSVVLLPRMKQRAALLLAITSHLLCRQAPTHFHGPVVYVGMDVDVTSQLRHLSVQNRRRMGLADGNPLSLHRLTRSAELVPAVGSVARPADGSIVYLNLRVGSPELVSSPALVILDAGSVESPSGRARALRWAADRGAAAVVVVGDLGDVPLPNQVTEAMKDAGAPALTAPPLVLELTCPIAADLVDTFGTIPEADSLLCSAPMLVTPRSEVRLHLTGDEDINAAVTAAFQSIGAKPPGRVPAHLDATLSMMRNGLRLAARVPVYRAACVDNPRPGEMPTLRLLDREVPALPGNWEAWRTARLGQLRTAVRMLWRSLEEGCPKLTSLWAVLDELDRSTLGQVVIRCHSRAAGAATLASLCSGTRTEQQVRLWGRMSDRVRVSSMKERFEPWSVEAQVLTGAPPPWLLSLLLGVEANTTVVLGYAAELRALQRLGSRWAQDSMDHGRRTASLLGAVPSPAVGSPVPDFDLGTIEEPNLSLPGVSFAEVIAAASSAIDPSEDDIRGRTRATTLPGEVGHRCTPVELKDGRTWWCIDDEDGATPVVVVTAAGPQHRPVRDLRPGDQVLVPAGEGTESIHARLVAASRGNAEVRSLDLILRQFRLAAREVLRTGTRAEASARVEKYGAAATTQLPNWASGATIAPREPGDVEAVFKAAERQCPDLNLIYAVAGTLRSLNRHLSQFVEAAAAGRGEDAVARLRELIGPTADDLLDEFVIAMVSNVGQARVVPSGVAGRLR